MTVYGVGGLALETEIPLVAGPALAHFPRFSIELGPEAPVPYVDPPGTILARYVARSQGHCLTQNGDQSWFRAFGLCDFSISKTNMKTQLCMSPALGREFASVVLAGTLSSVIGLLRGNPVVHAGAACDDAFTVGIAGASGSGKTTLLASMAAAGARVLTDDALRLEPHQDTVIAYPGTHELRLRPRAVSVIQDSNSSALRTTVDGRYGFRPKSPGERPRQLDALLLPHPDRRVSRPVLEPVSAQMGLERLLHLPRLSGIRDATARSLFFRTLGHVVQHVPVFTATLPWGPPFPAGLGREVLDLSRGLSRSWVHPSCRSPPL